MRVGSDDWRVQSECRAWSVSRLGTGRGSGGSRAAGSTQTWAGSTQTWAGSTQTWPGRRRGRAGWRGGARRSRPGRRGSGLTLLTDITGLHMRDNLTSPQHSPRHRSSPVTGAQRRQEDHAQNCPEKTESVSSHNVHVDI